MLGSEKKLSSVLYYHIVQHHKILLNFKRYFKRYWLSKFSSLLVQNLSIFRRPLWMNSAFPHFSSASGHLPCVFVESDRCSDDTEFCVHMHILLICQRNYWKIITSYHRSPVKEGLDSIFYYLEDQNTCYIGFWSHWVGQKMVKMNEFFCVEKKI